MRKHLYALLRPYLEQGYHYGEPFLGMASVASYVASQGHKGLTLSDASPFVHGFWDAMIFGQEIDWSLLTEENYHSLRAGNQRHNPEFVERYGYAVACALGFGCSFGEAWLRSRYWGHRLQSGTTLIHKTETTSRRKASFLKNAEVELYNLSYQDVPLRDKCLIYCDPPYRGTTCSYSAEPFDPKAFDQWCRERAREGHIVLVSEYTAPPDAEIIFTKPQKQTFSHNAKTSERVELVYTFRGL